MKNLGDYLKQIRTKKNITIEQAALVTKIGKSTLIAIEEADTKELPAKSYLRGFVFSYGKFLGANKEQLNILFSQEMGTTNPEITQEEVSKDTWKTVPFINKIQFNSKTYIVCSLIALTAIAFLGQNILKKYSKKDNAPIAAQATADTKAVAALQDPPKAPTTSSNSALDTKQTVKTINANSEPKNPLAPDVKNQDESLATVNEPTFNKKNKYPKELLIEAKEDTSFKIKIGDETSKVVKLLKGDFHTIKAKSKVILEPISTNDIKVIYNGTLHSANKNEAKSKILNF